MLEFNTLVPTHVRQGLFSRSIDNDDLLLRLRKPVLVTHGTTDAIVDPAVVDRQMSWIAHAQIFMMVNAGHACNWDQSAAFNQRLREFVEGCK